MNVFLWVLQVFGALVFTASGGMKLFMFDQISAEVPTFGAFPRPLWMGLGGLELVCVLGLIVPSVFRWHPRLTVLAASTLALESLLLIWAHIQYAETAPMMMSALLGALMAFLAYGRSALKPIL